MGSRGQVKVKAIWDMLTVCAPGYAVAPKPHNVWVLWNGRTYAGLPKYQEIDIGHVRKMI